VNRCHSSEAKRFDGDRYAPERSVTIVAKGSIEEVEKGAFAPALLPCEFSESRGKEWREEKDVRETRKASLSGRRVAAGSLTARDVDGLFDESKTGIVIHAI
jgi:hypothetical protein